MNVIVIMWEYVLRIFFVRDVVIVRMYVYWGRFSEDDVVFLVNKVIFVCGFSF